MSPQSEQHYITNPRQSLSLGFSGRSVEKLSVQHDLTVFAHSGMWRNLADPGPTARGFATGTRRVRRGWDGPSVLRVQDLLGASRLVGTHAHQQGRQHQREAADCRVADHNDPGRKRERRRSSHCHHPDRCRHQNQSCQHLTHPPRVSQGQPEGGAWQDYGRALVNLRRLQRAGTGPIRQRGPATTGRAIPKPATVPGRDAAARLNVMAKCLFTGGSGAIRRVAAGCALCLCRPAAAGVAAVMASPRAAKGAWWSGNPQLAQECLSFVIPPQQGGPAMHGDGK